MRWKTEEMILSIIGNPKFILILIGFTLLVVGFYFILDSGRMTPMEIDIHEKDLYAIDREKLDGIGFSSKGNLGFCQGMLCYDGGINLGP